jgi:6-pyruvoyltetrahydropterin/6-carboxytetrahydropterin synthase
MESHVYTTVTTGEGKIFKQSHKSTKKYGHDVGLSCCFRQWRATHSHCSSLHGYALSFKFVFGCISLDDKNWVADFGNLKELKAELQKNFDHTLAVAQDDPNIGSFLELQHRGLAKVVVFRNVGCEAFAYEGWNIADRVIEAEYPDGRVWVESCEVAEHGANSAIFTSERVQ